ncbi:MAG: tetratricopeptide repeat protein [Alphaproteobacteria bacterium]|nr:tetratricopeptide repeat protein [Alphaproteobacteria bacterium]
MSKQPILGQFSSEPRDASSFVVRANALFEQGNAQQAVTVYRQALDVDPAHAEAGFNLGAALAELGDLEGAVDAFRTLVDRQPEIEAAHAGLAEALARHNIGRFEPGMDLPEDNALVPAVTTYRTAIDAIPTLYGCHASLAELLQALGRSVEADIATQAAAGLSDDLPEVMLNLGATMRHPGDLAAAAALHREAMALAPDHDYMTERDYLDTDLTFTDTEILLPDGFEVMMEWERPIMERSAEIVCHNHGDVLNVGFGMAIIDTAIQAQGIAGHTIIEAHPQVIDKARRWAEDKHNVTIVPSTWQDALGGLPAFDGIYFDTLMPPMIPFLEKVPDLLKPNGLFLYFQYMVQFENLETMVGRGLRFGIEYHPFDEIPQNKYYRLNERNADGRYVAPMFIFQKSG